MREALAWCGPIVFGLVGILVVVWLLDKLIRFERWLSGDDQ